VSGIDGWFDMTSRSAHADGAPAERRSAAAKLDAAALNELSLGIFFVCGKKVSIKTTELSKTGKISTLNTMCNFIRCVLI